MDPFTASVKTTLLLLELPPTVTTTGPVPAVAGTSQITLVSLQNVGIAATELMVSEPGVLPNPVPYASSGEPVGPDVGEMLVT